jgi:hypothetical protein
MKNLKLILSLPLLFFMIVGCSTPEEEREEARQRHVQAVNERMQAQRNEENRIQALRNKCRSFGFQINTDAFALCLQRENMLYEQEMNQRETCSRTQSELSRENSRCTLNCLITPGMVINTPQYNRCKQNCDSVYPKRSC